MEKVCAPRARLEQTAVLNPALIAQIKSGRVLVSVQPQVVASEFTVWSAATRLGSERTRWLFPIKTLLEAGVKVLAGSDCPMEPLNPMLGVQAAVTRAAGQDVSVEQALCMYTVDAAFGSCEENIKGTVEEGKLAHLAVFSGDPTKVALDKVSAITAEITLLGGQVVT
jgi:predicted amidohydrolase YtcJ